MVRVEGLEPPRLSASGPKPGASTNSATPAHGIGALEPRSSAGLYIRLGLKVNPGNAGTLIRSIKTATDWPRANSDTEKNCLITAFS